MLVCIFYDGTSFCSDRLFLSACFDSGHCEWKFAFEFEANISRFWVNQLRFISALNRYTYVVGMSRGLKI